MSQGRTKNIPSPTRFILQTEAGQSLISVLVAAAIGVVVATGLATVMVNMQTGQNSVKYRMDADTLNEEIRALLSSTRACTNTFGGLVVVDGTDLPITAIRDGSPAPGAIRYAVGSTYGDRTIVFESMRLANYIDSSTTGKAQMTLTNGFATARQAQGAQTIPRTINIDFEVNAANVVTSCVALAKSGDSIWLRNATLQNNIYFTATPPQGNVGIGTPNPSAKLEINDTISGAGVAHGLINGQFSTDMEGSLLILRKARGLPGTPSAVRAGDHLGTLLGDGYDGNSFKRAARIDFIAEENFTPAANGTRLIFQTTRIGTTTPQENMRINHLGYVGLGTTSPINLMTVNDDTAGEIRGITSISETNGLGWGGQFLGASTHGVRGASTATRDGDSLGVFAAAGFNGTNFVRAGWLTFNAKQNFSTGSYGTQIEFVNIPLGGNSAPATPPSMVIAPGGKVGIGTVNPSWEVHVSKAQNLDTTLAVSNASNGANSEADLQVHNNLGPLGSFWVASSAYWVPLYQDRVMISSQVLSKGIVLEARSATSDIRFATGGYYGSGFERMRIDPTGKVGINTTTPAYTLDVNGDMNLTTGNVFRIGAVQVCSSSGCTATSDSRLKQNVTPLKNSFENILKLEGVSYDWIDKKKFGDQQQIGLIAQDVERVYPEVIVTDQETGLKSVAYDHLIAPLIEAFKALVDKLANHDKEILALKAENKELRQRLEQIEAQMTLHSTVRKPAAEGQKCR